MDLAMHAFMRANDEPLMKSANVTIHTALANAETLLHDDSAFYGGM